MYPLKHHNSVKWSKVFDKDCPNNFFKDSVFCYEVYTFFTATGVNNKICQKGKVFVRNYAINDVKCALLRRYHCKLEHISIP